MNTNAEKVTKQIRMWACNHPKQNPLELAIHVTAGTFGYHGMILNRTVARLAEAEVKGFLADSAPLAVDLSDAATAGMLAARLVENVPELATA